jgi:hypothetical protein
VLATLTTTMFPGATPPRIAPSVVVRLLCRADSNALFFCSLFQLAHRGLLIGPKTPVGPRPAFGALCSIQASHGPGWTW